jgi:hypothetical protein
MPFTLSENWDGVTAPTIPVGWNVDSDYVTATVNRYSTPNSLRLNNTASGTTLYATSSSLDSGGGATIDLTSLVYVDASAVSGDYYAGPTFRCSASPMNNTSTSCYWVRLWVNPAFAGLGGATLRFSSIVNGTVTDLYSVFSGSNQVQPGYWFSIRVVSYGSDVFNVIVTRLSDGYTMNPISGDFAPTASTAISGYHATAIASGGYNGLAADALSSGKIFFDDLNINTAGVVAMPRRPVIARIPFQYFIVD